MKIPIKSVIFGNNSKSNLVCCEVQSVFLKETLFRIIFKAHKMGFLCWEATAAPFLLPWV